MVDALLPATAHRPGSAREGRAARDPDAALSARKGRKGAHSGHKMDAGVDRNQNHLAILALADNMKRSLKLA